MSAAAADARGTATRLPRDTARAQIRCMVSLAAPPSRALYGARCAFCGFTLDEGGTGPCAHCGEPGAELLRSPAGRSSPPWLPRPLPLALPRTGTRRPPAPPASRPPAPAASRPPAPSASPASVPGTSLVRRPTVDPALRRETRPVPVGRIAAALAIRAAGAGLFALGYVAGRIADTLDAGP